MSKVSKRIFSTSMALLLLFGLSQASADPVPYSGTATLCFIGAVPPAAEQNDGAGVGDLSGAVSLYYIRTAPDGTDPPAGLVNGWEVLVSDLKVIENVYWLDWTGVFTPTAYAGTTGTALEETASVRTRDLSTLSGAWRGTGDLAGTRVEYQLTLIPGAAADCPAGKPAQCVAIAGGCLPAEPPYFEGARVYAISGFVN